MNQTSDPVIREATESDIPALLGLIRELAEYEKLTHILVATEEMYREALFGAKPVAEALLAFVEGEAVGYAIFFHNFSTFLGRAGLYLEDIYVRPQTRGKGVGKKLFATVARIAKDRNCGRYEWCVLKWNTPSIEFYEALGAESLDGWLMMRLDGDALAKVADMAGG
jgi:GNAT superfamily N-acetyltransferase